MAFLTMSMYSDILQMDTGVNVLLPEVRRGEQKANPEQKYPVLYLLHGHGDDHTAWIRKSNIELVAREYPLIVVMPTTYRGFYVDNHYGLKYYTYLTEELPVKIANFFAASTKREDTFIAGNSMGGYGAFRIAMANPERYAGAAALSGALIPFEDNNQEEPTVTANFNADFIRNVQNAFGSKKEYLKSDQNLCRLASKLDQYEGNQPILYQCCGTEDGCTYSQNKIFHAYMELTIKNLNYQYQEGSGDHNWAFWNPQIAEFFERLGIKKEL